MAHSLLQKRATGYYFRQRVPLDLVPVVGRQEIAVSLRTRNYYEALQRQRHKAAEMQNYFEHLRGTPSFTMPASIPAIQISHASVSADLSSHSFAELYEIWRAENKPAIRTLEDVKLAYMRFESLCSKPIEYVTRDDARLFMQVLQKLPPNLKRATDLTPYIEAEGSDAGTLSARSVNKNMAALSSLFSVAERNGYIERNPMRGLRLKAEPRAGKTRKPFTADDLARIFDANYFQQRRDTARFWLPLLGLHTGARLNELGQLDAQDVKCMDGIWYLDINASDGKQLKNRSSARLVPLHRNLLALGFVKFAQSIQHQGQPKLFAELRPQKGVYTHLYSQQFGRWLKKKLNNDSTKVFHSFRHTFKDACRDAGLQEEIHDALTGHTSGSVGRSYGSGPSLKRLQVEVERLVFVGLSACQSWLPEPVLKKYDT